MDLQTLLDNAVVASRAEELKSSPIMTLGEAIAILESSELTYASYEKKLTDKMVQFDFGYMHPDGVDSWRGIYAELAIGYSEESGGVTAKDFLKQLKDAVGATFTGYKGGDFMMGKATPLHVDNYGHCSSTALVGISVDDYGVTLRTWKLEE
jgi:hypothetical protein